MWAAWLATVVGLVAVVLATGLHPAPGRHGMPGVDRSGQLWLLRSWDFAWYARIAEHGYPAGRVAREDAFFPLWPLLLAAFRPLGGLSVAGAVLAVPASALAFLGVARLAPREPGRAALALACLPASFSLLLLYPDALALAAATWACLLLVDLPIAGALLGAVCATARPNGFLVAIPLFWIAHRRFGPRWAVAVAAVPVAAAGAVHLYLWHRTGDPFAFARAQRLWDRGDPLGLITGLPDDVRDGHVQTIAEIAMAALAIGLCVVLFRRGLAAPWGWYAAAVLALSLGSGSWQSIGRQALFAFPIAWAAAEVVRGNGQRAVLAGIAANAALIVALPLMAP